jgi:asparagine synthase (glutamine-hydrolysing)
VGGLAGIVSFAGERPDPLALERMSARLVHRGPDGEGRFSEGGVAFAHRRRAIVPTRSVQPLVEEDLVLLLDGWIYDHRAVARELGQSDPGQPDTMTLLLAWRKYGVDVVHHIEGSYAFAVWERRSCSLFLVRDRMGVRPLYWYRSGPALAFASELPALLQAPFVPRDLAREHLAEYLSFRVVHSPRTLLRSVWSLEPATWLRADRDGVESRAYWKPRYAPVGTPRPPDGELVGRLQDAVEHAVFRRLVPGAPTVLYLSGGLGSTAIAAAARRLHRPLPTWTLGFADDPNPESPFAGRVAKLLGLDHHEVVVGSAELAHGFSAGVASLGHPIGNPAAFLQLALARAVGREARVVLSGDGGEELFGGQILDGIARQMRWARVRAALRLGPPTAKWGLEHGVGGSDLFSTGERTALLRDPATVRPDVRREVLEPLYAGLDTDPFNAILHVHLRSWLQEGSLVRADRSAAAAGLDVRFPLLDHEVLDLAFAVPGAGKLRRVGGSLHTRWPLRAVLDGVIPPPLVHRPKRGLPTPLDPWLAGHGRLFLEERMVRLREDPAGLWNPPSLEALHRDVGKRPGAGSRLWALFMLDEWLAHVTG